MSFLQRLSQLVKPHRYDEAACIQLLFDRSQPLWERGAAAESLYIGQTPTATAALLKFVTDGSEEPQLREEAAASLGAIYSIIGVDENALASIPSPYKEEVLAGIPEKRV